MDILLHEDRSESSVSHVINILLTLLSYKGSHKQSKLVKQIFYFYYTLNFALSLSLTRSFKICNMEF